MLNLDFTGHPYFDVGFAAIMARADGDRLADLEGEDVEILEKVMRMDRGRIDAIRCLGDTLASYVMEEGDRQFFVDFSGVKSAEALMEVLIEANKNYTASGHAPLFGLDVFCRVFLERYGDVDVLKLDWRFARDLVLIRMIDWLYEKNWFGGD